MRTMAITVRPRPIVISMSLNKKSKRIVFRALETWVRFQLSHYLNAKKIVRDNVLFVFFADFEQGTNE